MKHTLVLILCAVGLLLVGGAAGMYASSLLRSHATGDVTVQTPPRQLAAAQDITPPAQVTPQTPATQPGARNTAQPPAAGSSGAATPRQGANPTPSATGNAANSPGGRSFGGGGQGGRASNPAFAKLRGKFELMRLFRNVGQLDDLKTPLTAKQAKDILAIMSPLRKQATLSSADADKVLAKLKALLTKTQQDAIEKAARDRMAQRGSGGGPGGGGPGGGGPGMGGPGMGGGQPGGQPPATAGNNGGSPAPFAASNGDNGTPGSDRAGSGGRPGGGGPGAGGPGGGGPGGGGPGGGRGAGGFGAQMETMNPFHPGDDPMSQRMTERYNAIFDALEAKAAGK